jgi:hypothetical protein
VLALLTWSAPAPATGEWTVRAAPAAASGADRCVLESPRQPVTDGYQTTWVQMVVDGASVRLLSGSVLDPGDRDIGVSVDEGALVPADQVAEERTAVFTTRYATLIEVFRQGLRAKVQLRFWPTWPKTGTHAATFSLVGFARAHARMIACRLP